MAAISITAASVLPSSSADIKTYTAGAAITAGQAVYQDTDLTIKLADADGASPLYKVIGIAACGAAAGQPVSVCLRDPDFTLGGTVAAGAIVITHTTAGAVCVVDESDLQPTTGWRVAVLGVGIGSNKINLFPAVQCRSDVAAA